MLFTDYIDKTGPDKLAKLCNVTPAAVYYWRQFRSAPRPIDAQKIINHSKKKLNFEKIYAPFVAAQLRAKKKNTKKKVALKKKK